MKKRIFLFFVRIFGKYLRRQPISNRTTTIARFIRETIKYKTPTDALKLLFEIEREIYSMESQYAKKYGKGIHTKHKHIKYHDLFIKNIKPYENVLDIGSGNGFLSYDMAKKVKGAKVTGIERNEKNLEFARSHYKHNNLKFIKGDVSKELPAGKFDVITLSNVLEHIEKRVNFLETLQRCFNPKRFIIRVPLFERDWRVPLKKELGIDYRLDPTHFIEYTKESFLDELKHAGLKTLKIEYRWSEIWCVAAPRKKGAQYK